MGEAPELRGFFLGCGFNSAGEGAPDGERRWWCGDGEACGAGFSPAGRRATLSTPRCENGVGGLPWRCVCKVGCGGRAEETVALHSHLARHDAGRRLWARAGQLDCPRAPGEGHVQLRHQASVVAGAGEKGRGGKG